MNALPAWLAKQPWNGLAAMALFFLPLPLIGLVAGGPAVVGALLYMATMFLIGEVNVKWVPLNKRWGKKSRLVVEKEPA